MRTDMAPGQWAQPVIVAVRRYKAGHFHGAHFRDNPRRHAGYRYTYDWAWRNYGSWKGNEQQWGFKMIQVASSRNHL